MRMNTDRSDFVFHIDHADQRRYFRVPFTVENDIDTLTIAYAYERHRDRNAGGGRVIRDEVNIVDLALEDETGSLVGASGSERNEITIHQNYATPGYRPARLTPGEWRILLGAYKIEEDGCPVRITVTQTKKRGVLLHGDCHTHTEHSDGWYSVDALIERARQDRLDFIFVTDHNSMASNAFLRSTPDLTVLPGVELTYYDGHANLLGVERPVRSFFADTREEVLANIREGRENGAL